MRKKPVSRINVEEVVDNLKISKPPKVTKGQARKEVLKGYRANKSQANLTDLDSSSDSEEEEVPLDIKINRILEQGKKGRKEGKGTEKKVGLSLCSLTSDYTDANT